MALPRKNGLIVKGVGGVFPQIHFHTVVVSSNHCSNAYAPGHSESQCIQTPLFVLVANDPVSWVTLGGSWFFGHSQPTAQAQRLHLSGNPSTAELGKLGLLPQLSRNQRTPCAAIETCIDPGNRLLQGLFLLRALRRLPLAPLVVTTERDSQEASHSANLKALTVSLDEEIATQGV